MNIPYSIFLVDEVPKLDIKAKYKAYFAFEFWRQLLTFGKPPLRCQLP